ncbi:MAG: ATP-binding cassette domain-containing protein [Candidatus Bathyarchaeia archaeon]
MPIVEVQNLCKEYPGKKALENVNFKVEDGEVFAVIGPNGAGKTTLLRILDLLDTPTSGSVYFNGVAVDYAKTLLALRRRIAIVFQQTVLFNTSVFNNVAYGLKIRGENKRNIREKVKEVLQLVRLQGFEPKNALDLSGGEAQRVALAQALIIEPELLLLDEPTANLDPKNVSIIEEALSWINKQQKTTLIMTTHNMAQAQNLANNVALLFNGNIKKIGPAKEIFLAQSKYLADFARIENVFTGISKVNRDGISVVEIGNEVQIEAAFQRSGKLTVYVRPEDIILSRNSLMSSARNVFRGRIVEMVDLGPVMRLKVDAGKEFVVQVTKRSFNEMQLNIGSEVFLVFKASAVQAV